MKPDERDAAYLWDMLQAAHPEIEWRSIIGQRNILAHQYGVIDHERLYRTGTESIPRLIAALEPIFVENVPGEP